MIFDGSTVHSSGLTDPVCGFGCVVLCCCEPYFNFFSIKGPFWPTFFFEDPMLVSF